MRKRDIIIFTVVIAKLMEIPLGLAIKGVLPKPIDLVEFQRILSSPNGRIDRAGWGPAPAL
jgi:hypothetical protein